MNKRKLQEFASWAKENLETQIKSSLAKIGIYSEKDIKASRIQGDTTVIDDLEASFPKEFYKQRESIVKRIYEDGYQYSIERFASTWFNRIVALRFLEVHDYLEHGYKIFPRKDEQIPEILTKLNLVKYDLTLDMDYCNQLTESSRFEDKEVLYRYVLFQQCNSLASALPMLFSQEMEYLEYFIPTPLLFGDTIITKLIEIDEQDFLEDVEVIGWLYQFYIASKKDAVFASKKTITKDTLPAVTQLFTPDWIVKYMAENSIGRIWLESYPNSSLRDRMKYYVEEAKQNDDVEEQLKAIRYSNVNPEDIKVIEPCSGSGHILVYCFDLLLDMYLERGYSRRDIPRLIFKNNLVGLDIDQRATQLASFAIVMRARSIDNRFFDEGRYVRARVYEIIDSKSILNARYDSKSYRDILKEYNDKQWNGENQLTSDELQTIEYVVNLFDNAKVIGSLLKVKSSNYLEIRNKLKINLKNINVMDVFTAPFFSYEIFDLLEILRLAYYLSIKYDVMITNPPYLGLKSLEDISKKYLTNNYPDSKSDMFAMFMESEFVKENGYIAMINMHSWMFLSSYQKLRRNVIENNMLISMLHLGARAFEEIGGDVVQTVAFALRQSRIKKYISTVYKLDDLNTAEKKEKGFLNKTGVLFLDIYKLKPMPGSKLSYWVSDKILDVFAKSTPIEKYIDSFQGIITGNNEKFLRFWHEVKIENVSLAKGNMNEIDLSRSYWIPYNKGGAFRKWYGNQDYVVNWKNGSKDKIRGKQSFESYYLKEYVSWSYIASNTLATRFYPKGFLWDVAGSGIFDKSNTLFYLQGFIGSKVGIAILKALNPTNNKQVENILQLPIIYSIENKEMVDNLVVENIEISREDWNYYENSWDYKRHPFVIFNSLISDINVTYSERLMRNIHKVRENEEIINSIFSEIYNLKDEIDTFVSIEDITLSNPNEIREVKSLISYLVGVLMGRYSLVEDGLIYAGGIFDDNRYGAFDIDKDGVIPIYSDISIEDGLVHRIIGLIKSIYGEEYYRDNVNFIASALGKKSNETSEETLNRYLNDGFYTDHLKIYQKRPIYWMFSSGKKSGFKALIYMHRYDENTLAKINAGYFQPATTILRNQISEIEKLANHAPDHEKVQLERRRLQLVEQLDEATEYGLVLDYMANKYISIDLDDGVKVNYAKFQNIEITTNNGKITRDLLVSIK